MMTSNAPFFPGYTYRKGTVLGQQARHKDQHHTVISGLMKTRTPEPYIIDKQLDEMYKKLADLEQKDPEITQPVKSFRLTGGDPGSEVPPRNVVLQFYAYFQESVTESALETYRVRYVSIYVYTEDDTIMIEEHRKRNSGMDQGVLLRRMNVMNPEHPKFNTTYKCHDFYVGIDIDIAGVVYHIYDCDPQTRRYLIANGYDCPEAEPIPDDLYTVKRRLTERPIRVAHQNTDKTNLANFLKYDGMVLRFYATWDDRAQLFGEKRRFVIIYFLVDGKIEIRQVVCPNSGRTPASQFLSKTLIKKPDGSGYYTDADLYIGQTVSAFGRPFVIYDADQFTKDWLDRKYGPHDWTPLEHYDMQYIELPVIEPPPYNGWGDELDSLGYVYSLHPKPPRKDIVKLLEKDGQVLRFRAKFVNPSPVDEIRSFVVCYYLADDTTAVYEPYKRNSGFRDGKFIQKGKYKNPDTGLNFKADDFFVGANLTINAHKFELTDADEYAFNQMEASSDDFPHADLSHIIDYLKTDKQMVEYICREFEGLDPEATGKIDRETALRKIVRILKVPLHDSITITRRWGEGDEFDYYAFMNALNIK